MVNTHYAISGALGAKLGEAEASAKFALGQTVKGNNASEWLYVLAGGNIAQYDCVAVEFAGTASPVTHALARARAPPSAWRKTRLRPAPTAGSRSTAIRCG